MLPYVDTLVPVCSQIFEIHAAAEYLAAGTGEDDRKDFRIGLGHVKRILQSPREIGIDGVAGLRTVESDEHHMPSFFG